MTEDQFLALMEYIDARIEEKIYDWHHRADASDALRTIRCRADLREVFGLPAER